MFQVFRNAWKDPALRKRFIYIAHNSYIPLRRSNLRSIP